MMKKLLYTLAFCPLLTLYSCVDFSEHTEAVGTVVIQLQQPEHFTDSKALAGRTVILTADGRNIVATTDEQGAATFEGLTPNVYSITTAWELTHDEYTAMTDGKGASLSDAHHFTVTGSLTNQQLTTSGTISLPLTISENQDIIIGKIYFATSRDNNNKNYEAGRYIELFNQSDEAVDVSGLYIGLTESEANQAYTLANLHEQHEDSVLLLKQIFRIPADEPFLVAPGGTVLLVNSAIDHTQYNTSLEADLSGADFEAKDHSTSRPLTNNPEVPALQQVYSTYANISNMNMLNNGLCGMVIFRTDEDVTQWPLTYKYPNTATKGSQWKLLHRRYVLDGVECLPNRADLGPNLDSKRLYADIDAGCAFINAVSGRSGEVVYRKTAERTSANGHRLLVDTNNSTNDFQVSTTIKPREYDE